MNYTVAVRALCEFSAKTGDLDLRFTPSPSPTAQEGMAGHATVTLGLPQMNAVNEQVRQRMHALFGAGYDYAYLYPGIEIVVQAAGRVIRTEQDKGTVVLIDDRFARSEVRALLPKWWQL